MSRMLKALQQIEAMSPGPKEASDAPPGPPPGGSATDDATVAAALARVQEMAAGESVAEALPEADVAGPENLESAATPAPAGESASRQDAPTSTPQLTRWLGLPSDDHAQAYGSLADTIFSQLPPGEPATLMFTSPGDGTGTTGVLVPLAVALLERNRQGVLAVDANLRRPALASSLGIVAQRGLADVLTGTASWQEVVLGTAVPGLRVLPGVRFPGPDGHPPERLNLGPLIEELGSQPGLVLIDTPSLSHGEVAPIARWCTGAYLVVRLSHTTRRMVDEAVEAINGCGGRVLGSVVLGA